jgi:choline-sulfatase
VTLEQTDGSAATELSRIRTACDETVGVTECRITSVRAAFGFAVLLTAATMVGCSSTQNIGPYDDAPVILISVDTVRADRLPIYGYRNGSTPVLDQLSRESIVFDDLNSHYPLTLPSHASLLTGLLPTHHGVRDNIGYALARNTRTIQTRFKSAGYATGAAVSAYVLRHQTGIAEGFDFFDDAIEMAGTGDSLADSQRDGRLAVDALANWIDRQGSSKVFAFLHLYEPHTPYSPPPTHHLRDPYDGEIAYADELVGRLLARVRARGWFDNAIVAVVSDHGEGLGDHGESEHGILLYREVLHVPWVLRLPGGDRGGRRIAGTLGLVDVAATLLDLAGLDTTGLDGVSARSSLGGQAPLERDVYSETFYPRLHLGWSDLASITGPQFKYIRAPRPELYDRASDPDERRNLVAERTSTARTLADALARTTAGAKPMEPQPASPEVRERLKTLGYVGSSSVPLSAPAAALPDPKDKIASVEEFKRALATEHAGRTAEAIELYRKVLASNPLLLDAWESLAKALVATGQTRDAIAAFEKAIEVDPLKPEPHLALARIYALEGDPTRARQHAEIGSERDPAQGFEILAALMLDAKRPAEAAAFARRSLEADPSRYMSEFFLGVIAQERRQCDEAIAHFERAIEGKRLEPRVIVRNLHAGLADCLAQTGRQADAEREYKAELAVIPDSPEARRGLAALNRAQKK